jgi:hypothetical protein
MQALARQRVVSWTTHGVPRLQLSKAEVTTTTTTTKQFELKLDATRFFTCHIYTQIWLQK